MYIKNMKDFNESSASVGNPEQANSNWGIEQSKDLYGIGNWGSGYFEIGKNGQVQVTPHGPTGPRVDLLDSAPCPRTV